MHKIIQSSWLALTLCTFLQSSLHANIREGVAGNAGLDIVVEELGDRAVPLLSLGVGYYPTTQSYVGLQWNSLLFINILSLEGKYYFDEEAETGYAFVSAGAYSVDLFTHKDGMASRAGLGYAFDAIEVDISGVFLTGTDHDKIIPTLGVAYHF